MPDPPPQTQWFTLGELVSARGKLAAEEDEDSEPDSHGEDEGGTGAGGVPSPRKEAQQAGADGKAMGLKLASMATNAVASGVKTVLNSVTPVVGKPKRSSKPLGRVQLSLHWKGLEQAAYFRANFEPAAMAVPAAQEPAKLMLDTVYCNFFVLMDELWPLFEVRSARHCVEPLHPACRLTTGLPPTTAPHRTPPLPATQFLGEIGPVLSWQSPVLSLAWLMGLSVVLQYPRFLPLAIHGLLLLLLWSNRRKWLRVQAEAKKDRWPTNGPEPAGAELWEKWVYYQNVKDRTRDPRFFACDVWFQDSVSCRSLHIVADIICKLRALYHAPSHHSLFRRRIGKW